MMPTVRHLRRDLRVPESTYLARHAENVTSQNGEDGVIFLKSPIPKDFDLMSIDVDGNDYHIFHSLARYRPRLLVIEFNPDIPNDLVFICSIPDHHIDPRRSALFMARSVLRDIRNGVRTC